MFVFRLSTESFRSGLRREVQQAIDNDIGAGNLVSVQEYAISMGKFSIGVWYREIPASA